MKSKFAISFMTITLITVAASEECDKCVLKQECASFGKLSQEAQDAWQEKFPCSVAGNKQSTVFGFASTAKGDYVCCSNAIWGATGGSDSTTKGTDKPSVGSRYGDFNNGYGQNDYDDGNQDYADYPSPNRFEYPSGRSAGSNRWGNSPRYNNQNNGYNNGYQNQRNPHYNTQAPKNYFNNNNNPYVTASPFFNGNGRGNNQGQCPVTSFPPDLRSGCCGLEATDDDRIIGHQPRPSTNQRHTTARSSKPNHWRQNREAPNAPSHQSSWPTWAPDYNRSNRVTRSADGTPVTVEIGDRIAGGRETELEQFPWTALLKVTFDYGNKRSAFNCGASLISSRYVLTAGHCVYDEGGKVVDIDVYLAEYDKRTFPKDCKFVLGHGQKCIENIVMKGEDFTLHPQYEDAQLKNDIALIRLQRPAPYTDYIRPICLPSIDIDTPQFSNLRLAVAGWGRNGQYRSDIKQSTVVNLVPQQKCKKSYPGLSRRNICAAGYTGEDTCKGDSGGPLMTVYGGKYEVVGVVSGKRADSPCGTSVPSLYTNVYHYLDWIKSSIRN